MVKELGMLVEDEVVGVAVEVLEGEVAGVLFEDLVDGARELGPDGGGFRAVHLRVLLVGLYDEFFAGGRHGDEEGGKKRSSAGAAGAAWCGSGAGRRERRRQVERWRRKEGR